MYEIELLFKVPGLARVHGGEEQIRQRPLVVLPEGLDDLPGLERLQVDAGDVTIRMSVGCSKA